MPTCHTFPHVMAQDHVLRTAAGEFRRLLVDQRGRQAKKFTTPIYTVTFSAPVCTWKRENKPQLSQSLSWLLKKFVVSYEKFDGVCTIGLFEVVVQNNIPWLIQIHCQYSDVLSCQAVGTKDSSVVGVDPKDFFLFNRQNSIWVSRLW